MKRPVILILMVLVGFGLVTGQTNRGKQDMVFDKAVDGIIAHDFGSIVFGANGVVDFTFMNNSSKDLIITDVKSSCNCAIPKYSKEPVKPGQRGSVTVEYNTKLVGAFNKTVVVYSNANNSPVRLEIRGKVNPQPNSLKPGNLNATGSEKVLENQDAPKTLNSVAAGTGSAGVIPPDKAAQKAAFKNAAGQRAAAASQAKTKEEQQAAGKKSGTAGKK